MTDPQTDTPAADEDVVRAARLDSLGTLLSRILNGLTLTPDEGKLLTEHIDTEVRESTTARAVAASNKRHVQTIAPEIDRLTAELEDAEQRADSFRRERDQARNLLAAVLDAFPDTGPDGPAIRSQFLPAGLVHRWKQQASGAQPEPDDEDDVSGPLVPAALMDAIGHADREHEENARALAALDAIQPADQTTEK
jgi:hypothetical protein